MFHVEQSSVNILNVLIPTSIEAIFPTSAIVSATHIEAPKSRYWVVRKSRDGANQPITNKKLKVRYNYSQARCRAEV
jgi:hypothetical protein